MDQRPRYEYMGINVVVAASEQLLITSISRNGLTADVPFLSHFILRKLSKFLQEDKNPQWHQPYGVQDHLLD